MSKERAVRAQAGGPDACFERQPPSRPISGRLRAFAPQTGLRPWSSLLLMQEAEFFKFRWTWPDAYDVPLV